MNDRQRAAARRVVRAALLLQKAKVDERRGTNVCQVTEWFTAEFGWGNSNPWCAMTVCEIGFDAGVLRKRDMSAGAWALNDHLHALGCGIDHPIPGATVTYSWGSGHIETIVKVESRDYVWTVGGNTGGNDPAEGDGCKLVRRYLPGTLVSRPFALFPGVKDGWDSPGRYPDYFDRVLFDRGRGNLQNGGDVRHVQNKMVRAGLLKERQVDGIFGAATREAVERWQNRHGLPADGSVHGPTARLLG
jgi:hypothetical protein